MVHWHTIAEPRQVSTKRGFFFFRLRRALRRNQGLARHDGVLAIEPPKLYAQRLTGVRKLVSGIAVSLPIPRAHEHSLLVIPRHADVALDAGEKEDSVGRLL